MTKQLPFMTGSYGWTLGKYGGDINCKLLLPLLGGWFELVNF